MYLEDEINIVGIVEEKELVDTTTKSELEKILIDALSIGPMLLPLIKDMESKGLINNKTGEIEQQDVVKSLYSNSYLTECPRVSKSSFFNEFLFLFSIFYNSLYHREKQ